MTNIRAVQSKNRSSILTEIKKFSYSLQSAASYLMGTEVGGESDQQVKVTPSSSVPPPPHAFMACKGTTVTLSHPEEFS